MRIRASSLLVAAAVAAATVLVSPSARADAGAWLPPDTLSGLVGSYTRPPFGGGPIAYVTLGGTDGYRAQGPYTRFFDVGRGQLAIQQGSYSAIANNPAVGAFILFYDAQGNFLDAYPILGIKRDPLGLKIIAIELVDAYGGKPFVLTRVGL
ncbi:MAG: hypothetical protein ACXVAN_10840 [Polyangia bacterium]